MALTESNATQPPFHDTTAVADERKQPTELVVREIIETLLLTFFIFWLVNSFVGRYRIDGSSMNPTLDNGQYLLINNFSYYLNEPNHGDIVVFEHPNSDLNLIKRVIGVPGDHVEVRQLVEVVNDQEVSRRVVLVNGIELNEPYIQAAPTYTGDWLVPDDEFFVLGDNRNSSSDSHSWGFLPEENIIGKAMVVYWPVADWELVPHVDHPVN
ncbi:signal peptidase I [Candidatus Leptofilum sp.]|uniref:signal peptidase I n=1 Tax=Candidatus Leptofilum sp. TaxID=3241576 RepID=UPI003B595F6E